MAQFCRHFPGLYRDSRYPTRDGVIPFARFWIMHRAMAATFALERISMARALGHTLGQMFAKDTRLPQPLRDDLVSAFLSAPE